MKKAFTMIELIFVIVVLGILASVAVPKLMATRTDAKYTAELANLRRAISEAKAASLTFKDWSIGRGYLGTYFDEHNDTACFGVGINTARTLWTTTHNFLSSFSANCTLTEAELDELNQLALKQGLIRDIMGWNSIHLHLKEAKVKY
jgi:prepilin-type N-terminal cleavage/methylation domain-containing protein